MSELRQPGGNSTEQCTHSAMEKITYFVNLQRVKINRQIWGCGFINRNRSAPEFLKGFHH